MYLPESNLLTVGKYSGKSRYLRCTQVDAIKDFSPAASIRLVNCSAFAQALITMGSLTAQAAKASQALLRLLRRVLLDNWL